MEFWGGGIILPERFSSAFCIIILNLWDGFLGVESLDGTVNVYVNSLDITKSSCCRW